MAASITICRIAGTVEGIICHPRATTRPTRATPREPPSTQHRMATPTTPLTKCHTLRSSSSTWGPATTGGHSSTECRRASRIGSRSSNSRNCSSLSSSTIRTSGCRTAPPIMGRTAVAACSTKSSSSNSQATESACSRPAEKASGISASTRTEPT